VQTNANHMHKAHSAPRCHAKAKTTGKRCKAPAKSGWQVCRMHGAGGGAPTGPGNGAWMHGDRSQAVEQNKLNLMALVQLAKDGLNSSCH
jgi:hypothetical protein